MTKEVKNMNTLHGGVKVEIYYQDLDGKPIDKAKAKKVFIRELDADENVVFETFGYMN